MNISAKSIYKSLILDYHVFKVLLSSVAITLLVATIIGVVTQPGTLIMVALTSSAFMLSAFFALTEKSNFSKLYGTLPLN